MEFKAAIFDLDGTLIDSLDDLHITMNRVLVSSGYKGISKRKVKKLIGNGAREFMRLSMPKSERNEANLDAHLIKYREMYAREGLGLTKPYDKIPQILQKLKDNNIKLAVLSNKPHESTVEVVERFLGGIKFDFVLGQQDMFPPKPDTASALYTAKMLNEEPSHTVFIGDGETDAEVGTKGGFYPVSVLWGYRTKRELKKAGAQNFLHTPADILKLFNL